MTGLNLTTTLLTVVLAAACSSEPAPRTEDRAATTPPADAGRDWFSDRAADVGLRFIHVNGASGAFYYPEILPPGVALFDFDNDGDLDVYVVQGRTLTPGAAAAPATPRDDGAATAGRLFRNDLTPQGSLHFTDVTDQSGIRAAGYGLGVAAGDIDNDGYVDLYLTSFGACQLLRNQGDGTFADVTGASGTSNEDGFAVSASFFDYDRDGWLDLYVGNNVHYTLANETRCPGPSGERDYCPPQVYGSRRDRLYHNEGKGRFRDVTGTALAGGTFGPALGVTTADYNGDGWIDVYVANDGEENLLWINQQNGTFKETALLAGAAVNEIGQPEASMGVDAGDFDNDGDEDLFMTHLTTQGNNLYVNDGTGLFRDLSTASGLGPFSQAYTGWGTSWFDYDNDGWLDLLTVNGTIVAVAGSRHPFPYDQTKLLFRNLRNGRFENVTNSAGAVFQQSEASRGAAFGDVDNDGDVDVLVGNNAGPLRLLINNIGNRQHWLGVRLVGGTPPRDMLGAKATAIRGDGVRLSRRARSDGSYASANDPRVLFGLGETANPADVEVRWPDGTVERWRAVPADRWTTLAKGTAR